MKNLFTLGRCCATPAAMEMISHSGVAAIEILDAHATGSLWDGLAREENVEAIRDGARIMSVLPDSQLWIITEADRSATTILLSSEY